jgi:two-component system, NarL family, response regulator LiaR
MIEEKQIICIVEDNTDLREGMNMMIELSKSYILGGSFANAEDAIREIPSIKPTAVLMDINLPGMTGIQCVTTLKTMLPSTMFLMCTVYDGADTIFDSLKAGAMGYILKTEGPGKIIEALDDMIAGGSPMSSSIARKVVASFIKMGKDHVLIETLSDREKMVLDELAKGLIGKEVADHLNISWGTVRKHVQNIYKKLHVNTRVEAVNLYLKR